MKKFVSVLLVICSLFVMVSCAGAKNGFDGEAYYADKGLNESMLLNDIPFDPENDNYEKFIENPFVKTEKNAVSTFSADVDTAAYSYVRKLITSGYTLKELKGLASSSVRTEELVNYFSYDYKAPEEGKLIGTDFTVAPCPWNPETVLLTMGISTVNTEPKSKNNLVFLIDVSGSMSSDDKLPLLKKAFSYLVAQLDEDDTVSIVTYSGKEEVVLKGCKGSKGEMITDAVNFLKANGSTNGQAGLQKAYQIAEEYFIEDGNNRIIMASDGDLNVGISSPEELKNYIAEKRNNGVYLSVLGFGTGNFKDANMEALADEGNGVYYYIDSKREAEKIFGDEIFSTLYTVAEDVKFQLTFDPETVSEYRLIGYENRLLQNEDFDDDTKDAGDIGAGHRVTVCYELKLTDGIPEEESELAKLAVRYKNPGELQSNLEEYPVTSSYYTEEPDDDFGFAAAVIEFSMLLHDSEYLGEDVTLESIISAVDEIESKDFYRMEFSSLLRQLALAK